jgi:hypothetical protein
VTSYPRTPLDRMPAEHEVMTRLWQLDRRTADDLTARGPHAPHRYFGPKTPMAGKKKDHFDRVIDVCESIKRNGYDPARFGGHRPRGVLPHARPRLPVRHQPR